MDLYNTDDIVALATPQGTGALAIVRLSGKNLSYIYEQLSQKKPKNRTAVFTKIYHPKQNIVLDHSIITFFAAPNSFTGEDIIEITCHGGRVIYQSIIDAAVDCGVRVAAPGEFSFRAFINKKVDLIQAESIANLISSTSKLAAKHSFQHLDGRISKIFIDIKNDALEMLTIIENELNFSDDEIDFISINKVKKRLMHIEARLKDVLLGSTFGEGMHGEPRIVILGKSNAGKSTLFNAIIGQDKAITSSKKGTTRDIVEAYVDIGGVTACLVDTAGYWETADLIDKVGMEKASQELERANICIIVDENNPKNLIDSKLFGNIKCSKILIRSKSDLLTLDKHNDSKNIINVSIKNNTGMQNLLTAISTLLLNNVNNNPNLLLSITRRQRSLIDSSLIVLQSALNECQDGVRADILASILNEFTSIMKDVLGEISPQDVINNIFSNFCIGK